MRPSCLLPTVLVLFAAPLFSLANAHPIHAQTHEHLARSDVDLGKGAFRDRAESYRPYEGEHDSNLQREDKGSFRDTAQSYSKRSPEASIPIGGWYGVPDNNDAYNPFGARGLFDKLTGGGGGETSTAKLDDNAAATTGGGDSELDKSALGGRGWDYVKRIVRNAGLRGTGGGGGQAAGGKDQ